MNGFTTRILLEPALNDSGRWRVVEALNFHSEKKQRNYIVPPGFMTNLASVRGVPFAAMLCGGHANAAAVVHDWLYDRGVHMRQIKDRLEADEVFLEAMLATGVASWRASLMYYGVRALGARRFNSAT